jgi:hypothetical protein
MAGSRQWVYRSLHWVVVRPGTYSWISFQFLQPCSCTAVINNYQWRFLLKSKSNSHLNMCKIKILRTKRHTLYLQPRSHLYICKMRNCLQFFFFVFFFKFCSLFFAYTIFVKRPSSSLYIWINLVPSGHTLRRTSPIQKVGHCWKRSRIILQYLYHIPTCIKLVISTFTMSSLFLLLQHQIFVPWPWENKILFPTRTLSHLYYSIGYLYTDVDKTRFLFPTWTLSHFHYNVGYLYTDVEKTRFLFPTRTLSHFYCYIGYLHTDLE